MAAAGADAKFYPEDRERIEEGDGEDDSRREPELVLEDAGEGEDEGDHPEGGLGFDAAVGGSVLVADVKTAGAEFFHGYKDNRWEGKGLDTETEVAGERLFEFDAKGKKEIKTEEWEYRLAAWRIPYIYRNT
jgi:hypothetical protein